MASELICLEIKESGCVGGTDEGAGFGGEAGEAEFVDLGAGVEERGVGAEEEAAGGDFNGEDFQGAQPLGEGDVGGEVGVGGGEFFDLGFVEAGEDDVGFGETREEGGDVGDGEAFDVQRVVAVAFVLEAGANDEADFRGLEGGEEVGEGGQAQRVVVVDGEDFDGADGRGGEAGGEVFAPGGQGGVEDRDGKERGGAADGGEERAIGGHGLGQKDGAEVGDEGAADAVGLEVGDELGRGALGERREGPGAEGGVGVDEHRGRKGVEK